MTNRLRECVSPYLLQHADNPVHWQPWDAQALAAAYQADKPILLSIGYAACHWCHVMEAESFADAQVAALMNTYFINVKVDREQRPDLDRIYQAAHYVLTRRTGGWPLTVFLSPDGQPFFAGTYFPPQTRGDLPSFTQVLRYMATVWRDKRDQITSQNAQLMPILRSVDSYDSTTDSLSLAPVTAAMAAFVSAFDRTYGGLGQQTKFPHPVELACCLSLATLHEHEELLSLVTLSLEKITAGGLYDHVAGGFFRYCVDEHWQLPHFEKMLYDNALLVALLSDAGCALATPSFSAAAKHTADWLLTYLRCDDGAFYASLDADSSDGEGAFYLWSRDEIAALLTEDDYAVVAVCLWSGGE